MKCIFRQFSILLLLWIFSFTVHADILEQAPLNGGDGVFSVAPAGSQAAAAAVSFQFSDQAILNSISWWGSYDPSAPSSESFTVRVFGDNGAGVPTTNFLYETTSTGSGDSSAGLTDLYGGTVSQYVVGVNWLLQGNTDYYLSIFSNDENQDWYWLESSTGGPNWIRAADGDAWSMDSNSLSLSYRLVADQLITDMPEPATLSLLLLPLLWFARRHY